MSPEDPERTVRAYYDALDDGDYDRLRDLLAPEFVQVRPDRTFQGREAFVSFVRDERPEQDTTHELAAVYRADGDGADGRGGGEGAGDDAAPATTAVAARGSVVRADGSVLVRFVDAFTVADGTLTRLETYTR